MVERTSEVEVTFTDEGSGHTRVDVHHRQLERHGPGLESVRDGAGGGGGWPLCLSRYAAVLQG